MKTHKIFDIDQSKYFCSKDCMLQSTYYRESLSNSNPLSRSIAKSLPPIDSVGGIDSLLSALAPKMKINYDNVIMKSTDSDSDNEQDNDKNKADNANTVKENDINPPSYHNSTMTSTGEVKKAIIPNLHVNKIIDNSKSLLKSVKEVIEPPILKSDIIDGNADYSGAPMKIKMNIKPINMPMPKSSLINEKLLTNVSPVTKTNSPDQSKKLISTASPDMKNKKSANDKKEGKVKFINKYNFEKPSPPHPTTVETFVPTIEFTVNSTKNEIKKQDIVTVIPEQENTQHKSVVSMSVSEFVDDWKNEEKLKLKKGYTQAWVEPTVKQEVNESNLNQALPVSAGVNIDPEVIAKSEEVKANIKEYEGKTLKNDHPYTQYNSPEKESTKVSSDESEDDEELDDLEYVDNDEEQYDSNNDNDDADKNIKTTNNSKKNPRYTNNEYGVNDTSMFLRIWTVLSDLFESDALIASDEYSPEISFSKLDITTNSDENPSQRPIPILDTPHWNARNAMSQLIQRGIISAESIINLKQRFDRDSLHLYDQSKLKLLTLIFYPPSCPSLSTSEWTFIGLLLIDAIYRYRNMNIIDINEWNTTIENGARTILNTYTKSKTLKEEDLKVLRLFFQMETNKTTDRA